jgi:hypothetical protein
MDTQSHNSTKTSKKKQKEEIKQINSNLSSKDEYSGDNSIEEKAIEERKKEMELNRLRQARQWILVVMSYYFIACIFKIFPMFEYQNNVMKAVDIIQALMGVGIFIGWLSSFFFSIEIIKPLLFIQAVQLIISNFNSYDLGTEEQMDLEDN